MILPSLTPRGMMWKHSEARRQWVLGRLDVRRNVLYHHLCITDEFLEDVEARLIQEILIHYLARFWRDPGTIVMGAYANCPVGNE